MPRRRFLPALAILCAAAAPPAPSLLQSSLPADGATLTAVPHWARLYFKTDVIVVKLELKDSEGRPYKLRWGGPEDTSPDLEALMPDYLPKGSYTLHWVAGAANGQNEDNPPLKWGKAGVPQQGDIRFVIK